MKTLYNTKIALENLTEEKYDMLIDFLQGNNISYDETDFEEFVIDERTEEKKYDDWLAEQADIKYDENKIGLK